MPYILNKTNGTILTTVADASLDTTTDLTFLGRNFAGYGEVQNENFLKLLENFSNSTPPTKPIEGQLWFDSVNKKINVYDNTNWKMMANLEIADSNPVGTKNFSNGDFWFDSLEKQLYVYTDTDFSLIGPLSGDAAKSSWKGSREYSQDEGLSTPKFNLKAVIGEQNEVIALVSAESYSVLESNTNFPIFDNQRVVKKGITLVGSDEVTGISENNGNYFWGTAAHSLRANTATYALGITAQLNENENTNFYVPFTSQSTGTTATAFISTDLRYNPSTNTLESDIFSGIATSAYYADLAERYESDNEYDVGTVVVIGGDKEITVTHQRADTAVAGVISKNPAFMMNKDAGSDKTHPYVALRGRVFCKVIGTVKKGSLLVTSSYPGYAEAYKTGDSSSAVIGKALTKFDGPKGLIEILV